MRGVDTDTGTLELRITGIIGSSCSVALSQTLSALTDGVVSATMKLRATWMSARLLRKTYTNIATTESVTIMATYGVVSLIVVIYGLLAAITTSCWAVFWAVFKCIMWFY